MPEIFPPIKLDTISSKGTDRNPAILLFGRRFFADQTIIELLAEFLLVASSKKQVQKPLDDLAILPPLELIQNWPSGVSLTYAANVRLNLKLFAFFTNSKRETRHETHGQHYNELKKLLKNPEQLLIPDGYDTEDILLAIEQLFLGLQGVGGNRTWCAQSFIPIAKELIAGESIWNFTKAKNSDVQTWQEALDFFSYNQQLFYARGGEVLYLQICNALGQRHEDIRNWADEKQIGLSNEEKRPEWLHNHICDTLTGFLHRDSYGLGKLAAFIDTGVDTETAQYTDFANDNDRFLKCGWCPKESWPEGYLFAVAVSRLLLAAIDPMETIDLLELLCGLQVIRSLCSQSARYSQQSSNISEQLGFIFAISDPDGSHPVVKKISQRCVKKIEKLIFNAIRSPEIEKYLQFQGQDNRESAYLEADKRYGHKFFLKIAKTIGLIVPRQGAGARFVLTERLLRLLVMTVIQPGKRITYDTFKHLIYAHYGMVMDKERLSEASNWIGIGKITAIGDDPDAWVQRQLVASGMLIRLSDSCAMVQNPFGNGRNGK